MEASMGILMRNGEIFMVSHHGVPANNWWLLAEGQLASPRDEPRY